MDTNRTRPGTTARAVSAVLALAAGALGAGNADATIISDSTYAVELGYVAGGSVVQTGSGALTTGALVVPGVSQDVYGVGAFSIDYGNCATPTAATCVHFRPGPPSNTGPGILVFQFKLVAVKTISWSHDDESPKRSEERRVGKEC